MKSSVLGFGCAPILGSVDAKTASTAIERALELGITHFDLARSYGYGEAEAFVGRKLKSVRSSVRIATKFGIHANWRASLLQPLKPMIRMVRGMRRSHAKSSSPFSNRNSIADRFLDRIPLNARNMQTSLDASLRALKTDYIDYFFIHEPTTAVTNIDELCGAANRLKEQGKIRSFGLATPSISNELHEKYLDRFDILQFANSPANPTYEDIKHNRHSQPCIFFSPFQDRGTMSPNNVLRKMILDFPKSVVLCSMYNLKHIENNVEAVST